MTRVLAFLTATTILAGWAAHEALAPSPVAAAATQAAAAPKPQYGNYGFDAAGMNSAVTPGDNF